MKILWLSWKDIEHPEAGGAEVVSNELCQRLVKDGHEVIQLTSGFKNAERTTKIDGYAVIRVGNRLTVYLQAGRYIRANLQHWPDLIVEEINTIPFFSRFYLDVPRVLFFHMLCRQIWFYQLPKPLGLVGYMLEPLYLRLLNKHKVITVSDSTRQDLVRYGFTESDIDVISEGISWQPVEHLETKAEGAPIMVSLGSIRPMKRTLDQVKAFEFAKRELPDLKLKIAGEAASKYGRKVLKYIEHSRFSGDIEYLGKVSQEVKKALLAEAHLIAVTSVKEGWGLVVTEAASQGTPAVVYDVDGLRDSVRHNKTGLIAAQTNPKSLSADVVRILTNKQLYNQLRKNAWNWSKRINFKQSYRDLRTIVNQNFNANRRGLYTRNTARVYRSDEL